MAEMQTTMGMIVAMAMRMIVGMAMRVRTGMPLLRAGSAAADSAHQITSISLIRISSPATGISLPPPQSGQGSSRAMISTSRVQS